MSDRVQVADWPEYQIDAAGNVFRVASACGATIGRQLKWYVLKNGYAKVSLCRNSKRKDLLVHRLVASTFIGAIPKGMDVCHYDGNKLNNHVSNLRIDTRKSNVHDNIRLNKHNRGERCGNNKYTTEEIVAIKILLKRGSDVGSIARKTGIPKPTLYGIRRGNTWGWLDVDN